MRCPLLLALTLTPGCFRFPSFLPDLASLERDVEVAAASRRVVIAMELMEEHELQKQLAAGKGERESETKE